VLPEQTLELVLQAIDPFVQADQLGIELSPHLPGKGRQAIPCILKERRQPAPDVADLLRQNEAVLGQEPAELIDQGGPLPHQPAAHPVQSLDILLRHRLDRDKAHTRPGHGLADRLGVTGIGVSVL
jgi:hypothetical protein